MTPPTPTIPHHTILWYLHPSWLVHQSLYISFGYLFISFHIFPSFSLPLYHRYPTPHIIISTIIFLARSLEKLLRNPSIFISFIWGKNFLIFLVGLYAFARGFLYLSFDNDTHVIYELWKWSYSCVYMYEFCVGGIIWWVGL